MYPSRYDVDSVRTKDREPIIDASTDRLHNIAGTYDGKDDQYVLLEHKKTFPQLKRLEVYSVIRIM